MTPTPTPKKFFQGIIFLLIVFVSCDAPIDNPIEPHYTGTSKINNYLSFKSVEEFQQTIDKLEFIAQDGFSNWEREKGYVSYKSIYRQALNEWQTTEDEDAVQSFINKYDDILTISEGNVIPRVTVELYQRIVNRQRIYQTNSFINKIEEEYILTVKIEDADKLLTSKKIVEDIRKGRKSGEDGVLFSKFISEDVSVNLASRAEATCTTNMVASYFYNQSNCRNDRQVYISAKSYFTLYSNYEGDRRQPRVEIKVWGKLRTGTFCNWKEYETTLAYRNVSFAVMAWEVIGNITSAKLYIYNPPDYAPTNDRYNLPWDQPIGNPVLNQPINASPFNSLHAEGTSRGVDGNWAIIDCN